MAELLALQELKSHLNLTRPMDDAELRIHLEAAVEIIDGYCGPTAERPVTVVVTGSPIVLSVLPVLTLTSITPAGAGSPADLTGVTVGADGTIFGYAPGRGARTTVAYQAGRATAPASLKMAAMLIAAHSWRTQKGPTPRSGLQATDDDVVIVGSTFAIPRKAWEYMQQFTAPAFA